LEELRDTEFGLGADLIPAGGNVNGGAAMDNMRNMRTVVNVCAGGHRTLSCKRKRSNDDSTD
jgi:hypothetical protein